MLHYKVYQNNSKNTKLKGKWFARAAVIDTINLEQLSEHMANHNTPYSKGAIYGVLTDMVGCIRERSPTWPSSPSASPPRVPTIATSSVPRTSSRYTSAHVPPATSPAQSSPAPPSSATPTPSSQQRATAPTTAAPTTAALRRAVPRRAAPRPATPTRRSSRGALGDNF